MHVHFIDEDYTEKKHYEYLLASDLHIGSNHHDRSLLKSEFDEALKRNAKIMIAGDWGEFIISGDRKRYSPSGDKYGKDNAVNRTIDESYEFMKPYAHLIEFIGTGNHEASMSKFHGIDPTQSLIAILNHSTGAKIKHGQYSGFVRFRYRRKSGKAPGGTITKIMHYNHGQGSGAEITKGLIGVNRHMTSKFADVYWSGHSHTKVSLPCENMVMLNQQGDIITLERKGIITGAYVHTAGGYDAQEQGYKVNFGEERMRTIQSTGGFFLTHDIYAKHNEYLVKTRVVEP